MLRRVAVVIIASFPSLAATTQPTTRSSVADAQHALDARQAQLIAVVHNTDAYTAAAADVDAKRKAREAAVASGSMDDKLATGAAYNGSRAILQKLEHDACTSDAEWRSDVANVRQAKADDLVQKKADAIAAKESASAQAKAAVDAAAAVRHQHQIMWRNPDVIDAVKKGMTRAEAVAAAGRDPDEDTTQDGGEQLTWRFYKPRLHEYSGAQFDPHLQAPPPRLSADEVPDHSGDPTGYGYVIIADGKVVTIQKNKQ